MQNFLINNKIGALMAILILAVGSVSILRTAQYVMGSDGSILSNILGGCIYGACKDTKITGNVTNGIVAGCVFAGCKNVDISGGEPAPNTGTLIVTKVLQCAPNCPFEPGDFKITVTGNNPSPSSFDASTSGTEVTLGPGAYSVVETGPGGGGSGFLHSFSGNCIQDDDLAKATGNINAGEKQECTITNTQT